MVTLMVTRCAQAARKQHASARIFSASRQRATCAILRSAACQYMPRHACMRTQASVHANKQRSSGPLEFSFLAPVLVSTCLAWRCLFLGACVLLLPVAARAGCVGLACWR
mmetsp:Transcript_72784/g.106728  ORF Transcript_72784/g.106728 Transcript_72784/m.106728 type:complete len:110 (-) Transcript_72784:255-584(-)